MVGVNHPSLPSKGAVSPDLDWKARRGSGGGLEEKEEEEEKEGGR